MSKVILSSRISDMAKWFRRPKDLGGIRIIINIMIINEYLPVRQIWIRSGTKVLGIEVLQANFGGYHKSNLYFEIDGVLRSLLARLQLLFLVAPCKEALPNKHIKIGSLRGAQSGFFQLLQKPNKNYYKITNSVVFFKYFSKRL